MKGVEIRLRITTSQSAGAFAPKAGPTVEVDVDVAEGDRSYIQQVLVEAEACAGRLVSLLAHQQRVLQVLDQESADGMETEPSG